MNNKLSKSSLQTHTDTLEIYNLLRNTNISKWRIEQDQMCASWYLIMLHRSRWYASEKGVVYGITCSCNRVKIWKKKSSLVGLCMKFYKSSGIFRIQSFKIRPLQYFYKKAPFLTFEDEKTTLEWPKLVSEAIFPTNWAYIWSGGPGGQGGLPRGPMGPLGWSDGFSVDS